MKETELYKPIKEYLLKNGYIVQAEVKNCDIACLYENKLIVIEMKKSFNLKLLYQAMDRKVFADKVFVAINRPKNFRKKETKHMLKILKTMDIGLITVALDSPLKTVEIILEPQDKKIKAKTRKRTVILNEIGRRNLDINIGGSSKKDNILTAYREQTIFLACVLNKIEKASPSYIKKQFNIQNASYILQKNHYGYFKRIERGVYTLSKEGKDMLNQNKFKEAILYYTKEVDKFV
ncbi:DUF2161 family putative PD-(D/E)XK-type phosphodiesterase [[Clostridium] colinum]|uniref:DUF2161 family putative PD-(D/E)XK-type phosphodiesterase n=1 Tax=[Clostridium] colinum TaxID=36835 RepID=UPI0020249C3B|nr:DUF2161 family putative PD-(D/E)XK-type phosphodiesterase [[Clostridium] colinum]